MTGTGVTSDLSTSAPTFTPAGGAAVPYVEVSATAPPPVDVGVEGTGSASGEPGGNVLTSMLFGSGKDGEEAPSSTVDGADDSAAAATEGSPEQEKDGGVMNFFEKVAVAVGLVSSDDESEDSAAAEAAETTATNTTDTAPSAST